MRGMIGSNRVHRAVRQRNQDGFAVESRPQWRIHLEIGVVVAHVFVDQGEMMRGDFAGHTHLGALGAADRLQRLRGREVRDVQAPARHLG